ncbi:cation:proton antiporter [Actinomadura montaniterrae]|uniref:Cation:proton antiporter n=1 Tax=Actinomadura montaniterrae TaxID=1803903 RepID=A0A6L3VQS9_9ACTN|nr:cation:proton antiporter [Actinomadura montaniterrae]KAB2379150.1 cation:proton antiporter [Actinomadura montaniterrae]
MEPVVAVVIGDIALVFVTATLLGAAARRCGQPAVVGQIIAGILLGPSLLGRLPGHLDGRLFPSDALPYLTMLSQVAIVVFMFSVGYELELGAIRGHGRVVPLLALGALLVPMALGMGCVLLLHPEFADLGMRGHGRSFLLFMGVATSITALPVLAAIVRERGLARTTAGVVATAAAGIMDALAWLVLAAALIGGGRTGRFPLPVTILLVGGFVVVMLAVVRPALAWWTDRGRSVLSSPAPVAFALAMGSAWVTASLGLHPVFGAFLAGLAMHGRKRAPDADVLRAMDQVGSLLLPLFFVVTGLSLNIGAVRGKALLLLGVVVVVACAGKLVPSYGISRLCGLPPRESATIAALMNTRGLTELIALNVGLADGIIDRRLFTVLVLMALITTFATWPLLSLIRPTREPEAAVQEYVG